MKNILINLAVIFTMLILAACGSGGGSSAHAPVQTPKTVATLKINLSALPASPIIGANFTLTLPANVTPANTNGDASGAVSPSGTFAGGGTVATYTAATANAPGTLVVVLASVPDVTQAGEVATITLQLANGAAPTVASFGTLSSVSVTDTPAHNLIPANATVASVTLN